MIAPDDLLDAPERARLSVADFMLLAESGALDTFAKSELIDGDVYFTGARFARHARATTWLLLTLSAQLGKRLGGVEVIVGVSIHAANDSMPRPDVVVTDWRGEGAVPAETIALIVEVSETTRRIDLGRKAAIYAAAGIPEYWVIDLRHDRVRRHADPGASGYAAIDEVPFGEIVEAVTIPGLQVETSGLRA